jgi:hypothetical protein
MKDSILGTGEKGAAGVHEVGKEEKLDTQLQKSMCLRLRGTPHPRYLHRPRKAHSGNGQDIISGNSEHYANILLDPITILQGRYYNDSSCLLALQLRKVGLERMSNFSKAIKYLNPSAHTHTHTHTHTRVWFVLVPSMNTIPFSGKRWPDCPDGKTEHHFSQRLNLNEILSRHFVSL